MANDFRAAADMLAKSISVTMRPRGHSMMPRIESGQLVVINPIAQDNPLAIGDVVLCKCAGRFMLHKITAMRGPDQYQIGNNHGHINGWIKRRNIFGKASV